MPYLLQKCLSRGFRGTGIFHSRESCAGASPNLVWRHEVPEDCRPCKKCGGAEALQDFRIPDLEWQMDAVQRKAVAMQAARCHLASPVQVKVVEAVIVVVGNKVELTIKVLVQAEGELWRALPKDVVSIICGKIDALTRHALQDEYNAAFDDKLRLQYLYNR